MEDDVSKARTALAENKGNESRLQSQLAVFVAFAKTLFQKEIVLRHDQGHQKRLVLAKIEEQIRSQLDSIENGGPAFGGDSSRAYSTPSIEETHAS